jgi:uncharacterized protein (DUF1501 family)
VATFIAASHSHQPEATLNRLLKDASEAIRALSDVTTHGLRRRRDLRDWSEFGRLVENGRPHRPRLAGASCHNTVGGFYGEPSSLANLDNGNLKYTTDFRSVYATVLEKWLNAPADDVLNGRFPQLGFLSA